MGRRALMTRAGVLSGAVLVLGLSVFTAPSPAGASPTVTAVAEGADIGYELNQWFPAMSSLYNYQFNGTFNGPTEILQQFAQGTVDLGFTASTYHDGLGVTPPPPGNYVYVPVTTGSLCLMYNLETATGERVTTLRLDAKTLIGIFTGIILNWNDARIAALNPGIALPDTPIDKVFHSDAGPDNFWLSSYFDVLHPAAWNAFTTAMGSPAGPQSVYPQPSDGMGGPHGRYDIVNFFGQAGSDIASQFVANNTNTITYVETAYAIEHNLPCAAMENQRGNFIQPSPTSTAAALKGAKLLPDTSPDLGSIFESPHANAYPISDYSFALTHTSGVPTNLGRELGRFFKYAVCWGQQDAVDIGDSSLPPSLITDAFADIRLINGALDPGPLTAANCPDLNLSGASDTS